MCSTQSLARLFSLSLPQGSCTRQSASPLTARSRARPADRTAGRLSWGVGGGGCGGGGSRAVHHDSPRGHDEPPPVIGTVRCSGLNAQPSARRVGTCGIRRSPAASRVRWAPAADHASRGKVSGAGGGGGGGCRQRWVSAAPPPPPDASGSPVSLSPLFGCRPPVGCFLCRQRLSTLCGWHRRRGKRLVEARRREKKGKKREQEEQHAMTMNSKTGNNGTRNKTQQAMKY